MTPIKVQWPGRGITHVEVWRVLDLSGLTTSPRNSKGYLKSGYVYLDGQPVESFKSRMEIGREYLLEIRFKNGITRSMNLIVVTKEYRHSGDPV